MDLKLTGQDKACLKGVGACRVLGDGLGCQVKQLAIPPRQYFSLKVYELAGEKGRC